MQSLIYAGQIMDDEKQLQEYRVPKVSCVMQLLHAWRSHVQQQGLHPVLGVMSPMSLYCVAWLSG